MLSVLSKCWFRTLVRRKHFCPKTWLCEPCRHYMDSLNLNCLKQDPTTTGTCGRLINSLYCISTFAINVYHICPLPVHDITFCITLTCISSDMQPMSASHCTTTHWPMLKFGGVSSSVESGLPSASSLSNSLMHIRCLPSISFRDNVMHLVCSEHCKHTFP